MTGIVCNSAFLASEIATLTGPENTLVYAPSGSPPMADSPNQWLSDCLRNNTVSLVLYESRFFVDPSPFREISPKTRFVVLSSPGEEQNVQQALVCGACAVIDKPLQAIDVRGILSLVSQ